MESLARRPERVMLGSVFIGVALVLGKLVVGLLTGSLGILSEAVHSIFDLAASTFTLVAVRTARKPADREHPYGHGRAENLAAFAEGTLLMITAVGIAFEAIRRLATGGPPVNPAVYAFALLIGTLLIESGRAVVLRRVGRLASSEAMLADATDRSAGDAEKQLRAAIGDVEGVREVRSVRVRRSGPNLIGDVNIATRRMLSVEGAGALADEIKRTAHSVLPTLDLSVLVEGQAMQGDLVERIHAAAARNGGVRDLHNVTVEREADGSLHLSMHAKLPGDMTL